MVEIAGLHVKVVRLEIAVLRRQWIQSVIRQYDGLRVLQLGEHSRREHVVGFEHVGLAGGQRLAGGDRASSQQRDVRTLAAFGERVPRLQAVGATAQLRRGPGGELVARGEEYLRAEALDERSP